MLGAPRDVAVGGADRGATMAAGVRAPVAGAHRASLKGTAMLTSLEDVIRRLIEGYDPDRIILFGSRARDAARPDSDIDLLIVKDTDAPPRERRMTVERLLSDRAIGLDLLVLTPRAGRARRGCGGRGRPGGDRGGGPLTRRTAPG